MLWTPISDRLAAITSKDQGKPRRDFVIVGAGAAGLAAATELHALGHRVEILEASTRVGGRVFTHRFNSGQYHELGAMRIPQKHDYTRHYIGKLGLELRPFLTSTAGDDYDIRNRRYKNAGLFPAILDDFSLSDEERARFLAGDGGAARPMAELIESENLTDAEKRALFDGDMNTDALRRVDKLSLKQALADRGWSIEALSVLGTVTSLEDLWDRAYSMLLRDSLANNDQGLEEIVGGLDLLPRGMADALAPFIEMGAQVLSIAVQADGRTRLLIQDQSGSTREQVCDHVLCTMAFGVLRRLHRTGFSPEKERAIRNMSYASSTKVILHCKERFWEQQGHVGGRSVTDTIARQIYYPNDSVDPVAQSGFAAATSIASGYGLHVGSVQAAGATFAPKTAWVPSTAMGAGALLASYSWGANARRLGALEPEDRASFTRASVRRVHPEIDRYVDDYASMFWDEHRWTMGAFAELEAGDMTDYFQDALKPEGGMHFAGEHLSPLPGWIQGAMYSGLRAVEEMV